MSVTIKIKPYTSSLDMHGVPDESNSYSLSGQVLVTPSPSAWLPRRRPIFLQSLVLTFDGQTELVGPGYSGIRLCSISEELVKGRPIEVSSDAHEDPNKLSGWEFTFDLRIPGWLPATEVFGLDAAAGVHYGLYATAQLSPVEDPAPSMLSSICAPVFLSKTIVKAPRCDIIVNRFHIPPSNPPSPDKLYPYVEHLIPRFTLSEHQGGLRIPKALISKVQVKVAIPKHIPVEQSRFPIVLRLSAPEMSTEDASKFTVTDFTMQVEQIETYRTAPRSRFPVSPPCDQPPNTPLRNPHPLSHAYELGLIHYPSNWTVDHSFDLLPDGIPVLYNIDRAKEVFTRTKPGDPWTWFNMGMELPFMHRQYLAEAEGGSWLGPRVIRPSSQSPRLTVSHALHFTLMCRNEGKRPAFERVTFSLPLNFIRTSAPAGRPVMPSPSTTTRYTGPHTSLVLPGYSQLYDRNGDRKVDGRDQLPAYSPSPDGAAPHKDLH
ncbi:hypothetical protein OF83DRAFT_1146515 [Amylostereum chailletii]|nr:hypothetical protein OF83DRAFT_1146515 [Amylostereum chailletii]